MSKSSSSSSSSSSAPPNLKAKHPSRPKPTATIAPAAAAAADADATTVPTSPKRAADDGDGEAAAAVAAPKRVAAADDKDRNDRRKLEDDLAASRALLNAMARELERSIITVRVMPSCNEYPLVVSASMTYEDALVLFDSVHGGGKLAWELAGRTLDKHDYAKTIKTLGICAGQTIQASPPAPIDKQTSAEAARVLAAVVMGAAGGSANDAKAAMDRAMATTFEVCFKTRPDIPSPPPLRVQSTETCISILAHLEIHGYSYHARLFIGDNTTPCKLKDTDRLADHGMASDVEIKLRPPTESYRVFLKKVNFTDLHQGSQRREISTNGAMLLRNLTTAFDSAYYSVTNLITRIRVAGRWHTIAESGHLTMEQLGVWPGMQLDAV